MTWLVLGILALVAVSLLGLGLWARRRSALVSVGALVNAAAVAAVAALFVYPALTDDSGTLALRKLERRVAEVEAHNSALTSERGRLTDEKQSLSVGMATALDKARDAERQSMRRIERIEDGVASLYSRFDRPDSALAFDHVRRPAMQSSGNADQRTDAIVADLGGLAGLRAKPTTGSIERPTPNRTLMRLKESMATTLKTENYDVETYPSKDLVGGRNGKYYVVDLKSSLTGIRYFFEGGKYTLKTSNTEFRTSLNAFISDVLSKMDGNVNYELFVRGNADQKPWSGKQDADNTFRNVAVLKPAGKDRYASDLTDVRFDTAIQNADLPNLRAAFLRKLIADIYPVKTPHVLDGVVSGKVDDRDRNAEIILFVDW